MKHKIMVSVIAFFTFFATHASASGLSAEMAEIAKGCYRGSRAPALVVNHDKIAINNSSGKKLSNAQIKEAMMEAGRKKNWSMEPQADGKMLATFRIRGKHTVVVEIAYSPSHYSIHYKDSTNMNHAVCDGHAFIHPNYNQWVNQLKNAIQDKLATL